MFFLILVDSQLLSSLRIQCKHSLTLAKLTDKASTQVYLRTLRQFIEQFFEEVNLIKNCKIIKIILSNWRTINVQIKVFLNQNATHIFTVNNQSPIRNMMNDRIQFFLFQVSIEFTSIDSLKIENQKRTSKFNLCTLNEREKVFF